jgi:excisionase family DNA binding protein
MSVNMNGINYLRTAEACQIVGISKNTFLRWVHDGIVPDVMRRDRRGWRIFSPEDVSLLKKEAYKVSSRQV